MRMETKKKQITEFSDNFLTVYCHFIYKYLGRKMLSNVKFKRFFSTNVYNKRYEAILKKANLSILPEEYFVSVYITIIGVFGLIMLSSIILLFVNSLYSLIVFYGGIIGIVSLGIFLYNYPIVVSRKRAMEIDASIPYLLPYMKILSKELTLSKIMAIISDFLIYKEIKAEFKKVKYYSEFIGYDIHSSIREAMQSCPSRQLADLMNDMVTISNSGGDIYSYLERKLNNLNDEITAIEKKNIDTLLIYSQVYVVLLLISPLFFAIMSSILNLVQISSQTEMVPGSGNILGIILMLFILPFLYIGFMMLIYYSKPLYSRLVPIKND